ncbi:CRISPR-associated endonuclease Cas3'' [Haloarcula nitratireducens]|uniref:CRISPR-associated endonuclease Cas3 n=1 Tax=Haloarcula nitratireducens TaxID=2487749 RepID=A0AAW4PHP8_9EURY|nr:CRISPR-associated endonuclease Cas3'' [Halomicroarcula nitratireducens]MBX0296795.1 CRISPR-associated endonuclease Cas3'' [Halomicroarcula nitratireducens]
MPVRYSHPPEGDREGVYLTDHLEDVAERVGYVVDDDATTPAGESLRAVVETLAHVHDFGKATTFFQQYLLDKPRQYDDDRLRYHAPLGSFAAYYALDAQGFSTETCLAGFVAVAKHHGQLPDIAEYVHDRTTRRDNPERQNAAERQQDAIQHQLRDIHEHAPDLAADVFTAATAGEGDWESFASGFLDQLPAISAIVGTSGLTPSINRDALSADCYTLVLQCWSALVLADKTSAADAPNSPKTYAAQKPSSERLDEYVRALEADADADPNGTSAQQLNHYRSRARNAVVNRAQEMADNGGGVARLTLPTGMGKTLSGLAAAFELRDQLDGERVVYALPFTSVIDQVVDELQDIYETDATGRLLTAHHHLAETIIYDEADEAGDAADLSDDVAGMLGESWRAGLTVSTFVQLFESLAGPRNTQSMKLPALRNSVIVLDEPQSLPLDWWKLVPRLVDLLTEQYDATVIAMTATQPKLFPDSLELVDNPDVYFEAVERVSYQLDSSVERYIEYPGEADAKSYDDAATDLCDVAADGASVLAVCNTVDSARKLTERVTDTRPDLQDVAAVFADELDCNNTETVVENVVERLESSGRPAVLHLSTRLRPTDRLALIEIAKQLTERDHPVVAVSTQLVEAGVDISFDRVYRDLAPIDSIVQAAGRCNRSFERARGRVTVWWLAAPEDQRKTPAEAVYNRGTSLLPVAADTLATIRTEQGELTETAVARDAVERYYERLDREKDVGQQAYADYVDEARADKLASLSLIDQRRAVDVVVCRSNEDRTLVESVRDTADSYEFGALKEQLDRTKSMRISVPVYREDGETADALAQLPLLLPNDAISYGTGIRVLDVREYGSHFDSTTGFVVPENSVDHLFI